MTKSTKADWEKRFRKPYHEWKESEDQIERVVYFIAQLSPHNIWKGYEAIQEAISKDRATLKKRVEEWSKKEWEQQMERAKTSGDVEKAKLAGYASGVIARMSKALLGDES